jgi:hypothetical protein
MRFTSYLWKDAVTPVEYLDHGAMNSRIPLTIQGNRADLGPPGKYRARNATRATISSAGTKRGRGRPPRGFAKYDAALLPLTASNRPILIRAGPL